MSKRDVIGIALSLQNKVEAYNIPNTDALEEIRKINENFVKLESESNVVKKVNALLNKRIVDMETQRWENAQFSRGECLKAVGIPCDVSNKDLDSKVLEVSNKVGCEIPSHDIGTCHRLKNSRDRIIVKFLPRKDCNQVMPVKRELRKV